MRVLHLAALLALSTAFIPAAHAQQSAEGARTEVRFSQMEETLRKVQGRLEELDYENRRLREALDRFQQDTNLRITDLEARPVGEAAAVAATEEAPAAEEPAPAPVKAASSAKQQQFATPREQYDHAFRLLNQTQYDEAGKAFEGFIASYPGDPLIGNAYYWAGETYYVRQNFTQAADYFRQGYEALPAGPKAGDNLLKLGMALNNLQKSTEACVVLKQVIAKFGATSGSIKNKAEQERARAGCK